MKYILLNTEDKPGIMPDPYDDSLLICDDLDQARSLIEDYEGLGFTNLMIVPLDRRLMDIIEQAAEFVDIALFELDLDEDEYEDLNIDLYNLLGEDE